MRRILITSVACLSLAACQSTPEGEAKTLAAIQSTCEAAKYGQALLAPWRADGRLSDKTEAIVASAEDALFAPEDGLCVVTPTQNLTGVLFRISSFALTISAALKNAKR